MSVVMIPLRKMIKNNFKAFDQDFLVALEWAAIEQWGIYPLVYDITPGSCGTFADGFCPMMVEMEPMIKTTKEVEYFEHLLRIMGKVVIGITDYKGGDVIKTAIIDREKRLLKLIKKTNMEEVDKMWAEAQIMLLTFVEMERYPKMLRLAIRSVLRCALAFPTAEGDARINDFLDSVTLEPKIRPGHWHRNVICIEMANCVYTYGYERFYYFIFSKVAEIHRVLKDSPNITADEKMLKQFELVEAGGDVNWQWDMPSESSWWFRPNNTPVL